jgi:hypothetical protein
VNCCYLILHCLNTFRHREVEFFDGLRILPVSACHVSALPHSNNVVHIDGMIRERCTLNQIFYHQRCWSPIIRSHNHVFIFFSIGNMRFTCARQSLFFGYKAAFLADAAMQSHHKVRSPFFSEGHKMIKHASLLLGSLTPPGIYTPAPHYFSLSSPSLYFSYLLRDTPRAYTQIASSYHAVRYCNQQFKAAFGGS